MAEETPFLIHPFVMSRLLGDLDLGPSEIMEVAVYGVAGGPARWELDDSLRAVEGLKLSGYETKSFDVPMLLTLGGNIGSVLQGIDVLLKWWIVRRASSESVRLEIRTKEGGKLDLSTKTIDEARELLGGLAQMLDQAPRKKRLPPRIRERSGTNQSRD